MNERDIMYENGVYHELYNEEPEPAIDVMNYDMDTYQ